MRAHTVISEFTQTCTVPARHKNQRMTAYWINQSTKTQEEFSTYKFNVWYKSIVISPRLLRIRFAAQMEQYSGVQQKQPVPIAVLFHQLFCSVLGAGQTWSPLSARFRHLPFSTKTVQSTTSVQSKRAVDVILRFHLLITGVFFKKSFVINSETVARTILYATS